MTPNAAPDSLVLSRSHRLSLTPRMNDSSDHMQHVAYPLRTCHTAHSTQRTSILASVPELVPHRRFQPTTTHKTSNRAIGQGRRPRGVDDNGSCRDAELQARVAPSLRPDDTPACISRLEFEYLVLLVKLAAAVRGLASSREKEERGCGIHASTGAMLGWVVFRKHVDEYESLLPTALLRWRPTLPYHLPKGRKLRDGIHQAQTRWPLLQRRELDVVTLQVAWCECVKQSLLGALDAPHNKG